MPERGAVAGERLYQEVARIHGRIVQMSAERQVQSKVAAAEFISLQAGERKKYQQKCDVNRLERSFKGELVPCEADNYCFFIFRLRRV